MPMVARQNHCVARKTFSHKTDLFKFPSEKRYELTMICQSKFSEPGVANFKIEKGKHQSSLTFGLRCARIDDILFVNSCIFSDGNSNKSSHTIKQLLHKYHKILALCNIKGELASSFSLNIAGSRYFVVLMQ